jgi:hypothetical protein
MRYRVRLDCGVRQMRQHMECVRFRAALRCATHREGLSRLQGPIQSA